MSKPHEMSAPIEQCPECNRRAELVFYKPRDIEMANRDFKQAVANHCINKQKSSFSGHARNDFCWLDYHEPALDGEYVITKVLRPKRRPDARKILDELRRKKQQQSKLF